MFVKNEAHMFNMIMSSTFLILPYVLVSYPTNMCYHTCLRSCLFFFFFLQESPRICIPGVQIRGWCRESRAWLGWKVIIVEIFIAIFQKLFLTWSNLSCKLAMMLIWFNLMIDLSPNLKWNIYYFTLSTNKKNIVYILNFIFISVIVYNCQNMM